MSDERSLPFVDVNDNVDPNGTRSDSREQPRLKKRRLELSGLKFDSPGAAFDFGIDLYERRPARKAISLSGRRSNPAGTLISRSAFASTSGALSSSSNSRPAGIDPQSTSSSDTEKASKRQQRRSSTKDRNGILNSRLTEVSRQSPTAHLHLRSGEIGQLQRQLDDVHSEHDMMVRELFHLTKFITYVGYDPDVAKEDRSHVFEHFRAENGLNLESKLATESSSRATRRVVSRRMDDLSLRSSRIKGKDKAAQPEKSSLPKTPKGIKAIAQNLSGSKEWSTEPASPRGEGLFSAGKKLGNQRRINIVSRSKQQSRAGRQASADAELLRIYHQRLTARILPTSPPSLPAMCYNQVPPPFFHGTLRSWLDSIRFLGLDSARECITKEEAEAWENREAEIYRRLDFARSQGFLADEPVSAAARRPLPEPTVNQNSVLSTLISDVSKRQLRMRSEAKQRQALARKTSRMVQSYWQSRLSVGERERKAEERHRRALAKWIVRQVNKQWKLAVSVIRAKKVKQAKLERERAGREQLSMILEQSTKYLGQRQEDLKRGRVEGMDGAWSESEKSDGDASTIESDVYSLDGEDSGASSSASPSSRSQSEPDTSHLASLLDIHGRRRSPSHETASEVDPEVRITLEGKHGVQDGSTLSKLTGTLAIATKRIVSSMRSPRIIDLGQGSRPPSTPSLRSGALNQSVSMASNMSDSHSREDARLDGQMRKEDESEDGEHAGLMADADLPIKELLKRSGYGRESNDKIENDETSSVGECSSYRQNQRVSDEIDTERDKSEQRDWDPASHTLSLRKEHCEPSTSLAMVGNALRPPFLLRGTLRPYQQTGFEWLASLYANNANGILADEMGLGKTIQTITLLAHLACDKGVWGPHLVIAPTSVMLNWEVEFKKFLPGFKILSYFGSQKERKEKRVGWNTEHNFNVCITSYQLVLADQHIFRRKPWVYMILDEAHHIKNFRSQRWQTLLGFNSQRRLLLTGTPLQNNLMDLWSLMNFLMPNGLVDVPGAGAFANIKDFQDWFSNPLDRAVELGSSSGMDDETRKMVAKLHTILRPFLLRRLKSEVEQELPRKYEHVIRCRLSKRQRFLYNDFMSRAKTRESLENGSYMSIIKCLMQLRKVCNHPDLFEVRPINTAFAMRRSVAADFEPQALLLQKRMLQGSDRERLDLMAGPISFDVAGRETTSSLLVTRMARRLDASDKLPYARSLIPSKPALDLWTVESYRKTLNARRHFREVENWKHRVWVNRLRTRQHPTYGSTLLERMRKLGNDPLSLSTQRGDALSNRMAYLDRCDSVRSLVTSTADRAAGMSDVIDRFAFVPPKVLALDLPRHVVPAHLRSKLLAGSDELDRPLHQAATKLQIAFPDASLLQYDCGKLQELERLMRRLKEGGHRILIFTQMTRVLDILEAFLNLHGYWYLRLDGATKVDRRQALTEKFNRDARIDAFILSTRSGGLGINLTGADTVLFYDLDWNSAIESQCMDRAHRIGQTRDVHIYRFVSEATIEENMLKKADQKRLLDSMVIQGGEFTTEHLKRGDWRDMLDDGGRTLAGITVGVDITNAPTSDDAIAAAEDEEDRVAAQAARQEMIALDDTAMTDFAREDVADGGTPQGHDAGNEAVHHPQGPARAAQGNVENGGGGQHDQEVEVDGELVDEEGTVDDYMLHIVESDWDWFMSGFKV